MSLEIEWCMTAFSKSMSDFISTLNNSWSSFRYGHHLGQLVTSQPRSRCSHIHGWSQSWCQHSRSSPATFGDFFQHPVTPLTLQQSLPPSFHKALSRDYNRKGHSESSLHHSLQTPGRCFIMWKPLCQGTIPLVQGLKSITLLYMVLSNYRKEDWQNAEHAIRNSEMWS